MVQRVIDLRKPNNVSDFKVKENEKDTISSPIQTDDSLPAVSFLESTKDNTVNEIKWTCHEHDLRERGPRWFLFPLVVETLGILYGIFTKSYIFIVFLVVAFILLIVQMKRVPRLIDYTINKRGVFIGKQVYGFQRFSSFWIFQHLAVPELSIETTQHTARFIRLRLDDVDIDEVRKVLLVYLPEKEQKELAMDQIARIIGF